MKTKTLNPSDRQGAMLPLIAVTMVILFVAAVFAIDIARIHVVRSELRTATDAAARAAVEALGRTESEGDAIQAAIDVARRNQVGGKALELDPAKIVFGSSVQNADGSFTFVDRIDSDPNDPNIIANSVRVVGERTRTSPSGQVNLLFGGIFGVDDFQPIQSATATRLDRDIALVLDKSGSMDNNGRFPALLNGVSVFVDELKDTKPKENVSLVAYDTFPRKLLDLTEDLDAVRDRIGQETPSGRTGIGRAMQMGLNSIQNDPKARRLALKSIVVMTDGRQNEGISPIAVANECRRANVTVHTITFSSGANQTLMQQVADRTGGTHLHATDNAQLVEAFRTIARQLQVLLIE
jgi:uncharacterized protein YegL